MGANPPPQKSEDPRGFNFNERDVAPGSTLRTSSQTVERLTATRQVPLKRDDYFASEDPANSDLAAIYAKPNAERISYKAGLPQEEKKSRAGLLVGILVILLLLGGAGSFLFFGRQQLVLPDLTTRDVSHFAYMKAWLEMAPEDRAMQGLDPEYLAYKVTKARMAVVKAAAGEYAERKRQLPRSIAEIAGAKLLDDLETQDGWGNKISLSATATGETEIVSGGANGSVGDDDDFYFSGDTLVYPQTFTQMDLERGEEAMGGR